MLEPIMSTLGSQRIVLASSSPRRKDILDQIGLKFKVIPSMYKEDLEAKDFGDPGEFSVATATNKVKDVVERLGAKEKWDLIIGVDTVVHFDGKVYGKPKNEEEAFRVLQLFSGNCHTVYSGVCLKTPHKMVTFWESTKVYFGNLNEEMIRCYVKSGDPLDKAGGYGIQMKGGSFIKKIDGDYFNVVGLPLYSFCKHVLEIYGRAKYNEIKRYRLRTQDIVRILMEGSASDSGEVFYHKYPQVDSLSNTKQDVFTIKLCVVKKNKQITI